MDLVAGIIPNRPGALRLSPRGDGAAPANRESNLTSFPFLL